MYPVDAPQALLENLLGVPKQVEPQTGPQQIGCHTPTTRLKKGLVLLSSDLVLPRGRPFNIMHANGDQPSASCAKRKRHVCPQQMSCSVRTCHFFWGWLNSIKYHQHFLQSVVEGRFNRMHGVEPHCTSCDRIFRSKKRCSHFFWEKNPPGKPLITSLSWRSQVLHKASRRYGDGWDFFFLKSQKSGIWFFGRCLVEKTRGFWQLNYFLL